MDLKEFLTTIVRHFFFLFIVVAIIIILMSLPGCAHESRVKLYYYDSGQSLFVRDLKNKDVLAPGQAHGFICMSKRDFERIAEGVLVLKASCIEKNYPFGEEK